MTRMIDRPSTVEPQPQRDPVELVARQLRAIEMFTKARAAAELAQQAKGRAREARMDAERRLDVLRREHQAIVAQTHAQLTMSTSLLTTSVQPRIVVAHRNEWFVSKLSAVLAEHGVRVAAQVDNGAEAVGAALSEQPDLVLVEDKLAMLPGEEVVREIRSYCPDSVVAVHADYNDRVGVLLEAGARAVYTRQVPPADVAMALLDLVGA